MRWLTVLVLCVVLLGCVDDRVDEPVAQQQQDAGEQDSGPGGTEPDARGDAWRHDGGDTADDAGADAETDPDPRDAGGDTRDAGDLPPDTSDADIGEPDLPEDPDPPTFEQFDEVVNLARGNYRAWAQFIHVYGEDPDFHALGYGDTAGQKDHWPASTIKVFPVTAALILLAEEGFSLDAEATFEHDAGNGFTRDVTMSFRDMIFQSFTCSSNETYTLLLRFAGADWLNVEFFQAHGFADTALMRGYNSSRPWAYHLGERQRITVREGQREWVREHGWSGASYANQVGCTIYNGSGTGNCSAPRDLAEHMRRVMFHEQLPDEERFALRDEDLDWVRYGGPEPVMNNKEACGGPGWDGVREVFPNADFFHKGGLVSEYRLDLQYVHDAATDSRYVLHVAVDDGVDRPIAELSEAVARMVRTPDRFVWLENLRDHVNPIVGNLSVYSERGGTLELFIKDYAEDGRDADGWTALPGTRVTVPAGWSQHELVSDCLDWSRQVHIRGRLWNPGGDPSDYADSDLHYVIADANVACP